MTRWAVVLGALAAGCGAKQPAPLTDALLGSDDSARATLARIVDRARHALRDRPPANALRHVVFDELGFAREIDDTDPRFMALPPVLGARRGSCVGLASLYLALGEALGPQGGFSVEGVLVPGHLFVRIRDARGTRNVELLRRGEEMPDAWYRDRYKVPAAGAPAYLRPLSSAEVLAVIDFNLGNHLRRGGRLAPARDAYARAARRFPALAEAHASLGLVLQLLGQVDEAARAYAAARAANPHLPGLEKNLAILLEESPQSEVTR